MIDTAAVVALMTVVANAADAQITCGGVISGKVVMTNDLVGCMTNPAVSVSGGSSLDMNGHQISGCASTGVILLAAGAKLSNGSVNGCDIGVRLNGTGTHKVTNVASVGNTGDGFQITGSKSKLAGCSAIGNGGDGFSINGSKNAIKRSTAGGNTGDGFDALGDNHNLTENLAIGNTRGIIMAGNASKLKGNTATANQQGVSISGAGNKLIQNTIGGSTLLGGVTITGGENLVSKSVSVDNVGTGFAFNGSNNKLSANIATDNTVDGYSFAGNGNNVKGCIGSNNGGRGFHLISGSGNLLKSNLAMGNTGNGVLVALGTVNGAVSKTAALENGGNDLQDDNANCDGNAWSKNVFRTSEAGAVASHACIQ